MWRQVVIDRIISVTTGGHSSQSHNRVYDIAMLNMLRRFWNFIPRPRVCGIVWLECDDIVLMEVTDDNIEHSYDHVHRPCDHYHLRISAIQTCYTADYSALCSTISMFNIPSEHLIQLLSSTNEIDLDRYQHPES